MQQFAFSRTEQGIRQRAIERQRREQEQARQAFIERYRYTSQFQTSTSFSIELRDQWGSPPKLIKSKFQRIEEKACKVFGINVSALKSIRRDDKLVFARQFVTYWAIRTTELSSSQIGRLLGGRDHTTILRCKKVYPARRAKMGRTLREAR